MKNQILGSKDGLSWFRHFIGKNEGEVFDVPILVQAFYGGPGGTTKNNKKRWSGRFIENIVSWFYLKQICLIFVFGNLSFRKLSFGKFSWARFDPTRGVNDAENVRQKETA